MADVVMAAQESRAVRVNCIVVGITGEPVAVDIELNAALSHLKEKILAKYPELKDVGQGRLQLFLAKKADGTWLSADKAFEEIEQEMENGSVPDEIDLILSNKMMKLQPLKTIAKALGNALPPEYLHVLVKIIGTAPSTAVSEHKDLVTRKRGAEAMTDVEMENADVVMEDAAMAAQVSRVRVNRVRCIVVGIGGQSVGIRIELDALVEDLKGAIKARLSKRLMDVEADDLLIFLAKKADDTWLSADDTLKNVERRMVTGEVPDEIDDIISDDQKLLNGQDTIAEALGSTSLPPGYLHFLVKPPLKRWTINPKESSAVTEYKRIAELLKGSKEVKAVIQTLEDVRKCEEPMPFVVLENSSGTGKTQMAFNLEAHGAFDVFYLPCTPSKDVKQKVYKAFDSRQAAFLNCIESDIALMEGEGSVSDFLKVGDEKPLKVYAFIIAALSGSRTFMGDAFLKDVTAVQNRREKGFSKPMVFFLDEFPRVGTDFTGDALIARKKLVRSMRNVFRFLGLPLIISATNGTARNLFTVSNYSRPSSGPVSWCMVIPSLPKFFTAKASATPVFEWILQHSRPLFGALAQENIMDHNNGQDQLEYLTDMVKALTPKFRRMKRETDFEKGQLYLFLAASYDITSPSQDMPALGVGSGRVQNREVNLIDGHYGRMEEQGIFELQLAEKILTKNKKEWKCRCVFPRLEDDILLYLTLMGDYEDTRAPQDSAYQRQLALPNNKRSPLDRPFWKKLRDELNQNGTTTRNSAQDANDGTGLETLAVGAVILASHQGGFYGVNFETFLGRLLYELGVRSFNKPMAFPENVEMENFTIPFLSPPNVAWPDEFVAFWENTSAQFANMERPRNGDRIDFTAHSGLLTGECKDHKILTLKVLKSVLERIPSTTKVHLVVVKCLQERYFTKTKHLTESSSAFLERIKLQHAKFYRVSRRAGGTLEEFPELMQARRDPSRDDISSSADGNMESDAESSSSGGGNMESDAESSSSGGGNMESDAESSSSGGGNMESDSKSSSSGVESDGGAGKTIIFIEVGDWRNS